LPSQDPQHAPASEKTGKAAILKGKPDPPTAEAAIFPLFRFRLGVWGSTEQKTHLRQFSLSLNTIESRNP